MTYSLLESLKRYLKQEAVQRISLSRAQHAGGNAELCHPDVVIGFPPAHGRDISERVPFISIQASDGARTENGFERVNVSIRIAVRNEDGDAGECELFHAIECIRRALLAVRKRPLEKRYTLEESERGVCPWVRPDEQAFPYLEAYIFTTWQYTGIE